MLSLPLFPIADFTTGLLGCLIAFLSVFLIMLVLLQRGRGGGLTGALGGPGGQSAFGSKAGDTFTLITVVTATVWAFACAFTMWLNAPRTSDISLTDNVSLTVGTDDSSDDESNGLDDFIIPTDLESSEEASEPSLSAGGEPESNSAESTSGTAESEASSDADSAAEAESSVEDVTEADTPSTDTEESTPADAAADASASQP
ncbi:MAG: preprotein translocase subunit SecG [Planctomycetota bacterium]